MPRGSARYDARPWADWSLAEDLASDFAGRESGFWGQYRLRDAGGVLGVRIFENEELPHDPLLDLPMDRHFEPEYRKPRVLLYA